MFIDFLTDTRRDYRAAKHAVQLSRTWRRQRRANKYAGYQLAS